MSVTTHLVCRTCKTYMWLGQGSVIYTGEPKTMRRLNEFMQKHKTHWDKEHELLFMDEPFNGPYENQEWNDED